MTQKHFFGDAKWVGRADRTANSFSVLRGHFTVDTVQKVSLNILGLGFFKCYVNGVCINPDTFLPLASDYEAGCDPKNEVLSGHRIYVPAFDITPFVKPGDNTIAVHYGGGWYTHIHRTFGLPKVIYRICVQTDSGIREFVSDTSCRIRDGYVFGYDFVTAEMHDYSGWTDCFGQDFDDSGWEQAVETEPLETQYCTSLCPWDGLIEEIPVSCIGNGIYDCGKNLTGYPVLDVRATKGEKVTVYFSEELSPDGTLDPNTAHGQQFTVIADGQERTVQPEFTWYGFRYFQVSGAAVPKTVKVVHARIPVTSSFSCDNETLNWIYKTFVHTMLCNMHCGIPSDCPHLERRGYTGDGQLTCHAVLSVMDARAFYEKWLQDIADSQDALTGRIQNTAPYILSGGGPGGWGCAIVEVAYQLYRHYGDTDVLKRYYGNMRKYIEYLDSISEFGLVTGGVENIATLGDWCCPNVLYPDKELLYCDQQSILPPPLVNTYFMVKSLMQMCEIARVIGKHEDIAEYETKIDLRKRAITAAYFNNLDSSFLMNIHGANAYAVDLGLGNQKTYQNIVEHYSKLGFYDTGIFATDILTRVLFENGDGELAVSLLAGDGKTGFENWRKNGATTFMEYWDTGRSRSHNHPMFGSPVAYFFEYLLGIRQENGTAGYTALRIEPQAVAKFSNMSGSMALPAGTVKISYVKTSENIRFDITVPSNTTAVLCYLGQEYSLNCGENTINISY